MIVSSLAAWSFGCLKYKLNQSLKQETQENNLENVNNEYFTLNESNVTMESNVYDEYNEYNEYEQYHNRYAEYSLK